MTGWQIANPWFLLLVLPATAAFLLALRRPPPALRVSSLQGYQEASGRRVRLWACAPLILEFAALLLFVVAAARPRKGIEHLVERSRGVDIVLCLDVSGSMRAYDIPESMNSTSAAVQAIRTGRLKSRVEVAKEELRGFVKARPDDRVGLIAFAAVPYVVCPPTLDHAFLLEHLDLLEAGMFDDSATGIAGPTASATQRLKDSEAEERVAVLFTDGANTVESKISPLQAARIADTFDVRVHTVGVGSHRAVIPGEDPFFGTRLRSMPHSLDEDLLREIAEKSGGEYFAATDREGFRRVMDRIDDMETVDFEAPRYVEYRERFPELILAGACLLGLGILLDNTLLCRAP